MLIVTKPFEAAIKYSDETITVPVDARVQVHRGQYLWGMSPSAIKGRLLIPKDPSVIRDLLPEAKQKLAYDQAEAKRMLMVKLADVDTLPRLDSGSLQKRMYDVGHESDWPYVHNEHWMKNINRELKHPALFVEKVKMSDGWHLAIVLYTTW